MDLYCNSSAPFEKSSSIDIDRDGLGGLDHLRMSVYSAQQEPLQRAAEVVKESENSESQKPVSATDLTVKSDLLRQSLAVYAQVFGQDERRALPIHECLYENAAQMKDRAAMIEHSLSRIRIITQYHGSESPMLLQPLKDLAAAKREGDDSFDRREAAQVEDRIRSLEQRAQLTDILIQAALYPSMEPSKLGAAAAILAERLDKRGQGREAERLKTLADGYEGSSISERMQSSQAMIDIVCGAHSPESIMIRSSHAKLLASQNPLAALNEYRAVAEILEADDVPDNRMLPEALKEYAKRLQSYGDVERSKELMKRAEALAKRDEINNRLVFTGLTVDPTGRNNIKALGELAELEDKSGDASKSESLRFLAVNLAQQSVAKNGSRESWQTLCEAIEFLIEHLKKTDDRKDELKVWQEQLDDAKKSVADLQRR